MSKQAFKRLRRKLQLDVSREPLPSYTSYGCDPVYYITADGGVLCPCCVNAEIVLITVARRDEDREWDVIDCEVNYEDTDLTCDHCGQQIRSAYGETEVSNDH